MVSYLLMYKNINNNTCFYLYKILIFVKHKTKRFWFPYS